MDVLHVMLKLYRIKQIVLIINQLVNVLSKMNLD